MAFASDSTTAPARPLLRPFTFRPAPPVDDARSTDELPNYLGNPEVVGSPLLLAFHGDTRIGSVDRCSMADLVTHYPDHIGVVENQPDQFRLDSARTLHMRRELHRALDQGFALLDALDLPPLALDVIDDAIATMDALDAPDEDGEDGGDAEASLGWTTAGACSGYDFDDREHDTADAELSCGWTAKISQIHLGAAQDDHETTALERYGKGFIRSGPDDAEDSHDAETVFEDGSDDEPYPWRFQRPTAVQIAARVTEATHHG